MRDVDENEYFGQLDAADLDSWLGESSRMLQVSMSMSMSINNGTGSNKSEDLSEPDVPMDPLVDDDLYYEKPPDGYYPYDNPGPEPITPVTTPATPTTEPETPTTTVSTPATETTVPATEPATPVTTPATPTITPPTTTVTDSVPTVTVNDEQPTTSSSSQGTDSTSTNISEPAEVDGQSAESSPNAADIVTSNQKTGAQLSKEESPAKLNTGVIVGLSAVALVALGGAGLLARRRSRQQRLYEL